jgi:tRNA nucleotidyltransferase (CCA-adding enzyme)
MQPSAITSKLDGAAPLAIYAAYRASDQIEIRDILDRYIREWRLIEPSISGHDLRARAIPPGPVYRMILETLRDAWLDGKITSPEEETCLLEELITELNVKHPKSKVNTRTS